LLISTDRIDPKMYLHNRSESSFETEEALSLFESIAKRGGNHTPITVRPHPDKESGYEFQIVVGQCRFEGCVRSGNDVLAIVRALDDRELAIRRIDENEARSKPWAYDIGCAFREMLEAGVFKNKNDIAASTPFSQPSVSKYISIAEMDNKSGESEEKYMVFQFFDDYPSAMNIRSFEAITRVIKHQDQLHFIASKINKFYDAGFSDSEKIEILSDFELFDLMVDTAEKDGGFVTRDMYNEVKESIREKKLNRDLEIINNKKEASKPPATSSGSQQSKTRPQKVVNYINETDIKVSVTYFFDGVAKVIKFDDGLSKEETKYISDMIPSILTEYRRREYEKENS